MTDVLATKGSLMNSSLFIVIGLCCLSKLAILLELNSYNSQQQSRTQPKLALPWLRCLFEIDLIVQFEQTYDMLALYIFLYTYIFPHLLKQHSSTDLQLLYLHFQNKLE